MSNVRSERFRRERAWDYAQANDGAVMEADPYMDQVAEAAALLDRDPDRAFFLLLGLARQGSIWSMVHLGWCCHVGRGTQVSFTDAEHWYRQAHEAGCDRALVDYARLLRRRGAVDQEADVYAVGVARDWAPALYASARLALLQARTLKERLAQKPLLERAADRGSPAAQMLLAQHMLRGSFGLHYVPAGIRRGYLLIKTRLAELDQEAEQHEPEAPPSGATLH